MLEDEAVDVTALAMHVLHLTRKQRGFSQRPRMTSSPGKLVCLQHFTQLHVWGIGKMLPSDIYLRPLHDEGTELRVGENACLSLVGSPHLHFLIWLTFFSLYITET